MDRSRTKLVCTIGPASAELIGELVAAGMDVARINFSHGTPDDHKAYVHAVRAAAHSARRSVAVMADLPGPKIRLGEIQGGEVTLETGATFILRPTLQQPETVPPREKRTEQPQPEHAAPGEPPEVSTAEADTAGVSGETTDVNGDLSGHGEVIAPDDGETAELRPADSIVAVTGQTAIPGDATGASVSTSGLAAQLETGDRILLADGAAELRVTGTDGSDVVTEVVYGGMIRSRSGVNIPSGRLTGDGLTDDDRAAVPRALELRVDLIAQSFVRTADDVRALKALLPADGPRLVAKIETQAALDQIDGIMDVADGIMVARGDLGVDIPFEEVPLAQKNLISAASQRERFTIVATQMLESMTGAPRPTRAEVSDVANAVLDGADAVMLSAETAIGSFPVEALSAMARICAATERNAAAQDHETHRQRLTHATATIMAATSMTGWTDVGAIWCFTRTGHTAEKLSMKRPHVPIVAFTLSPIVARRLAVRRGIVPMILPATAKADSLIERMEAAWRAQKNHGGYESVVLVTTSQQPHGINRMEVHRLGDGGAAK